MLQDVFTKEELLKAAEAAAVYPPGHEGGWGIDADGKELFWHQLDSARFL